MMPTEGTREQWKPVNRKDFINMPMIVRMLLIAQMIVCLILVRVND
jgi:hypothetical protein